MEKRESNFELLRIILIIMIIILHYLSASIGGALTNTEAETINYYLIHFIESVCIVSVNIFIIITGYFMAKKKTIKVSKIINLVSIVVFYGIVIYLISVLIGTEKINIESVKKFIQSIADSWFITIYCILYLLIPFINKLIDSISKKNFKILLGILIFFFSVWPSVWSKTTVADGGYGIINFIIMYLIGAYIKLYMDEINVKNKSILIFIISTIITTICSLVADRAYNYNFVFNIIGAAVLFLIFKNIRIKQNKIINKLASYTFAVYIIHTNPFIMENIFKNVLKTTDYYNSNFLIIHMIVSVLIIYVTCIIIETIRRLIIGKIIDRQIDKVNTKITCE